MIKDKKMLQTLRRLAVNVDPVAGAKFAAAVTIKNDIIAIGNNSKRTHPFQFRFAKNPEAICLHAEIDAIRKALNHVTPEDLSKATLFIQRVKKAHGQDTVWRNGMAKPCTGCMGAIDVFKIKRVVYSTDEDGVYEEFVRA